MVLVNSRLFRASFYLLTILSLSFLLSSCGEELAPDGGEMLPEVSGTLVSASECKGYTSNLETVSPSNKDCVTWDFDGSDILTIVHVNATLNCCPGTVVGLVDFNGGTITIEEKEGDDAQMCDCLCLYDFSYEVSGIQGGEITITLVEHYLPEGAEILTVTIDLDTEPQGSHCLDRNAYPWQELSFAEDPAGTVEEYSGCKTLTGTIDGESDTYACVTVVTFPASGTMHIYHTNTQLNCCVNALVAEYDITEGVITITPMESPPGGLCYCICPYDIYHKLNNLEPGIYTIRFVEQWLRTDEEELSITVDLSQPGSWTNCVPREL